MTTPITYDGVTYTPEQRKAATVAARKRLVRYNQEAIDRLRSGISYSNDPDHHIKYLEGLNRRLAAGELDDTFAVRDLAFRLLTHKPKRKGAR